MAKAWAQEVASAGRDETVLARMMVWGEHESHFGKLPVQMVPDGDGGRSYGPLQIKGRPDLEHDAHGSARAWLHILAGAEAHCKSLTGGLRELSSGRCDLATHLVASREAEADALLVWAYAVSLRPDWQAFLLTQR